jgi:hypothetical protein
MEGYLKWILKSQNIKGTDWIQLAHDRIQWLTVNTAVMSVWVPEEARDFLTS